MFYETRTRSVVKTILWRVIATVITWGTIYIFTGQLSESIKITVVAAIVGMIAYYLFERIANGVDWGKIEKK